MITSKEQYQRALAGFIREEEEGIVNYASLIKDIPSTKKFDRVKRALRHIASEEKGHITLLKRLFAQG